MAASNQPKSSDLFRIIWESFNFVIRNWKPVLICIFIYFISYLLTNLQKNLASLSKLEPPNPDFYPTITVVLKELREISVIQTVFSGAVFFISTLFQTATLCFICIAYAGNKQPTLKKLFSKFRKTWKGAMNTQFYATIFAKMSFLLMVMLIGGFALFSMNSAEFLVVSFIILIVAVILYLYLAMIWLLSVVVSVEEEEEEKEEEGIYGLAAIVKATEIIKGRRWKGIQITVFVILLEMVAYFFSLMHLSSSETKTMVIHGIFLVVAAVVNVFDLAVITVFYFDCKNGDGGLMKNKCG